MFFYFLPALLLAWGLFELIDGDGSSSSSGGGGSQEEENEQIGDQEANELTGLNGEDLLSGLGGNDILSGEGGNDGLLGGTGNDILQGGDGDDRIRGEDGDDLLIGGDGDDAVFGALGNDWVEGDAGNDELKGGLGSDILIGGTGVDTIEGGTNGDILFGGSVTGTPLSQEQLEALRDGDELSDILGVEGDTLAPLVDDGEEDVLSGENGNDILILGAGDKAAGGDGDDAFFVLADQAIADTPATISDFTADDAISVVIGAAEEPAVTVEDDGDDAVVLADGVVIARVAGAAGELDAADVAIVAGPTIDDIDPDFEVVEPPAEVTSTLTGDDDTFVAGVNEVNLVNAAAGDDLVNGGDQDDVLRGEEGGDILIGGDGNDELLGGMGDDLLQGNLGNDKILGGEEGDWLSGGEGDDELIANAGDDVVIGGTGADDLRGNNDNDLLIGGSLFASDLTQEQLIALRDDEAAITGLTPGDLDDGEVDKLDGGSGDDILIGAAGDEVTGGDGEDMFVAYDGGGTEAMIVNDYDSDDDSLAVLYDANTEAPVITVSDNGEGVFTVLADGAPVAVVASATGTITVDDVMLLERGEDGSIPLTN